MANPWGRIPIWTFEEQAEVRQRYEAGERISALAKELGASTNRVRGAIRRTGGTIKPLFLRGPEHPRWKGGRRIQDGYVIVWKPAPPGARAKGTGGTDYDYEHRRVVEIALGRSLIKGETVHHINGDTTDNRLENLQLRTRFHGPGQVRVCLDCGSHNIGAEPL